MRHVHESDLLDELEFAREAAAKFASNPKLFSYSRSELQQGEFLALRWGLGDDCVLVLRLHDVHAPTIYAQQIQLSPIPTTKEAP